MKTPDLEDIKRRHTSSLWDENAHLWEKELRENQAQIEMVEQRVHSVVGFLRQKGLMHEGVDIIDVGSGPCRFTAAFAEHARHVTATDISENMLKYGEAYCQEKGLTNVSFRPIDFLDIDLDAEGWRNRFDLAFASLTPAIDPDEAMFKFMDMSRAYCCNTSFVLYHTRLESEARAILGLDPSHPRWDGSQYRGFWTRLYDWGYLPEVHFHEVRGRETVEVTPRLAKALAFKCKIEGNDEEELAHHIYKGLMEKADDGVLEDETHIWFATTLWDVRVRLPRWNDGEETA